MNNLLTKIKKKLSNESGFTMIEIILVIALIAIIGAMLVPSFYETTIRSRIKTDINSLIEIQNAINLYEAEMAKDIVTNGRIPELISTGYLKAVNTQQAGGSYIIDNSTGVSDSGQSIAIYKLVGLDFKYKSYISGIDGLANPANTPLLDTDEPMLIRIKSN